MNGESRPWGRYDILSDGSNFKVKTITVSTGERLSLQRHFRRSEHWFVIQGLGDFTLDDKTTAISPGVAVDIPLGSLHRIANVGTEDLVFVEVQHGDYFGEDDIERVDDDYGRHAN